jgi:hypothetical protein
VNDLWSQFHDESVHTISALVQLGIGGVSVVLWFYYRRVIQHRDEAVEENAERLRDHESRLNRCDRQIRDTRTAVGEARGKLGMGSFPYIE